MKYRSFSCGRGVHLFFIGGFLPTHSGTIIYQQGRASYFQVNKLDFFKRISAFFQILRLKDSFFFSITTDMTKNDASTLLKAQGVVHA